MSNKCFILFGTPVRITAIQRKNIHCSTNRVKEGRARAGITHECSTPLLPKQEKKDETDLVDQNEIQVVKLTIKACNSH